jgi:hypothetical protein
MLSSSSFLRALTPLLAVALWACGARTSFGNEDTPPGTFGEEIGGSAGTGASAGASAGAAGSAGASPQPQDVTCWQSSINQTLVPIPGGIAVTGPSSCSLVGTWDVVPSSAPFTATPLAISFDESGRFVLGPLGADLCLSHQQSGQYAVGSAALSIWNRQGSGLLSCAQPPAGVAQYKTDFSPDCATLGLSVTIDNCTGSGLFRDGGNLHRRP